MPEKSPTMPDKSTIEQSRYINSTYNVRDFIIITVNSHMLCYSGSVDKEPDQDWAEKLVLPVRFSASTNKVMETGVLTSRARVEITTSLSTLMLVHTSRPTPKDLTTVSRRLIEKYPNLRDKVDNGFVS